MVIYQFPNEFLNAMSNGLGNNQKPIDENASEEVLEGAIDMPYGINSEHIQQLIENHYPCKWRLITLLGSVAFLIVALFFATLCCIGGACSLLTFFRNAKFNEITTRFWSRMQLSMTCAVGLLVATFSPALGLGMMLVYSAMKGDVFKGIFLNSALKI